MSFKKAVICALALAALFALIPSPAAAICGIPISCPGGCICGSTCADTLFGDAGNNCIYAYAGDDTVYGMAGNDFLDGGAGNDTLDGGSGTDICVNGESVTSCP